MWNSFCRLFSPAESKTEDTSMGNSSKKLAAQCTLLNHDEQKYVAATFKTASRSSEKIREEELIVSGRVDADLLEKYWGPQIDPRLAQFLTNYLFGFGPNKQQTCDFNRFAELYVYNVRGTADEKLKVFFNCLGKEPTATSINYQLLREFCESIVSTYIRMVKVSNHPHPQKWIEKGFRGKASNIQSLGETVAASVHKDMDNPANECSSDSVTRWLTSNVLLHRMAELVFENLYGVTEGRDKNQAETPDSLLPRPEGIDPLPDYPAFIDVAHIVWLNSQLPKKYQSKWRFLFSSHIHGESFSTLAGRIQDLGPTLVIIEDNSGYIFGGFASVSWSLSANFQGNEESFLFTLAPKIRLYPATGFNNHYQYMNFQTKTLPNGLMMGGQFDFGGFWINADPFGMGKSTDACATYRNYKRLSKEPEFKIRSLEVWAVGEKPLSVKESDERDTSILDRNPEAKAILDMAGRTRHSEGIREPEPL